MYYGSGLELLTTKQSRRQLGYVYPRLSAITTNARVTTGPGNRRAAAQMYYLPLQRRSSPSKLFATQIENHNVHTFPRLAPASTEHLPY